MILLYVLLLPFQFALSAPKGDLKEVPCTINNAQKLSDTSIGWASGCEGASLQVTPVVKVNNNWLEPSGACQWEKASFVCPMGHLGDSVGTLRMHWSKGQYTLNFRAGRALELEAIGLKGKILLPSVKGWLSNGFESWSQTGVIALGDAPSEEKLQKALNENGDYDVERRGEELSWWYSFVGSDKLTFLAGVSSADHLKSYLQFFRGAKPQEVEVRLISGGIEKVPLQAGKTLSSEKWYLGVGSNLQKLVNAYSDYLPSRRRNKPIPAYLGWNSWYQLWGRVSQESFLKNMALAKEIWDKAGIKLPLTMTIDDGWEKKWGDWTPNEKFPAGIDGVVKKIRAAGHQPGIWIAPLLVDSSSDLAKQHPDWMVKGPVYSEEYSFGVKDLILDVTNPAAARHLQRTIKQLVAWGMDNLKIDYLFGGTLEGDRYKPMTGMEAYHLALRLIREAAGEKVNLIAVGAPPLATLEYVDAWRVGQDIAFEPLIFGFPGPTFAFIGDQARSIAGRVPYCKVTLCDADPALLRFHSREEAETGKWVVASAGGAMVLSDDLTLLPKDRFSWNYSPQQLANGISGKPAIPESYYPPYAPASLTNVFDHVFLATFDVPEIWLMPDGTRLGINFSSSAKKIGGVDVPAHATRNLPQK